MVETKQKEVNESASKEDDVTDIREDGFFLYKSANGGAVMCDINGETYLGTWASLNKFLHGLNRGVKMEPMSKIDFEKGTDVLKKEGA